MDKKNKQAQSPKPNIKVRDTTPHEDVKAGSSLAGVGVGTAQRSGEGAVLDSQHKEGGVT